MQPYWLLMSNNTFVNNTVSAANGNVLAAQVYLQQVILPMFDRINSGQSNWTASRTGTPRPATADALIQSTGV